MHIYFSEFASFHIKIIDNLVITQKPARESCENWFMWSPAVIICLYIEPAVKRSEAKSKADLSPTMGFWIFMNNIPRLFAPL